MTELFTKFAQQTMIDTSPLPNVGADHNTVVTALDIVFTITGSVAVLVIVIAGLRYILSRGNPQAISQAKDAIVYACVGLVISISAYTIIALVAKSI